MDGAASAPFPTWRVSAWDNDLDVERFPATTLAFDVRVMETEGLVEALFDEIDRGAVDERQALGIDEHLDALVLENQVRACESSA